MAKANEPGRPPRRERDREAAGEARDRPGRGGRPQSPERLAATGRNDACPCGSGKKYKKCHLAGDEQATIAPARGARTPGALAERLAPVRAAPPRRRREGVPRRAGARRRAARRPGRHRHGAPAGQQRGGAKEELGAVLAASESEAGRAARRRRQGRVQRSPRSPNPRRPRARLPRLRRGPLRGRGEGAGAGARDRRRHRRDRGAPHRRQGAHEAGEAGRAA